jgi:growth factor-regulated tyrosine kinase substrate
MEIASPPQVNHYHHASAPPNYDLSPTEMENIQLFSTLMEHVHARGGNVANDPQINKLYTQIGSLQPKLLRSLDDTIQKHRKSSHRI